MAYYYLKVAKKELTDSSGETRRQFEQDLRRKFRSYDYLCGYCDGYGFGKIEILPLKEIERINNTATLQYLHYNYLYLVQVKDEDED